MFKTRRRVLRLGPRTAKPGDEIWMLQGGDVSSILRAVAGSQCDYNLLGECYRNGYMHGEKIAEDPKLLEKMEEVHLV